MRIRLGLVAAFSSAALLLQAPLEAKEPLVLAPSTNWLMRGNEDNCRLSRTFGEGKRKVAFYIERYDFDPGFELVVAGGPLSRMQQYSEVYFQFGPDENRQKLPFLIGRLPAYAPSLLISHAHLRQIEVPDPAATADRPRTFNISEVGRLSPERRQAITWLGIGQGESDFVRLDLGPMDKPMAAMDKCVDKLVARWGIDLEKHRHLTRAVEPVGNPANWIRPSDYPASMLSQGKQGLVQFRIMVGPDGKPTSCHIQQSTRPQEFDDAVCNSMMKHAEFKPALDADGQPIPSFWRETVRFVIP